MYVWGNLDYLKSQSKNLSRVMELCIKHHRKRITEKKLCVLQIPNSTKNSNSTYKDKKCSVDVNDYLIL